jgi:hypothetical protein
MHRLREAGDPGVGARVTHGTPEGFRLHKRLEHEPCPACRSAMDQLLSRVRAYRSQVARSLGPVDPPLAFTRRMLEVRREMAARERTPAPPLPPVVVPATACVGMESWMPAAPRTNLKKFRQAGWQARLTRAAGPRIAANGTVPAGKEVVYTVALAAKKGDEKVVMVWQYDGEKWKLDDILHNKRGLIKSTDLKEIL